jgi:hypothetical protein
MKKFLIATALALISTGAFAQNSVFTATYPLAKYLPGFRTINGTQLNSMVAEVNSLTGTGTLKPITGSQLTLTGASATELTVGRLGATTPAFTVDSSTGSQTAGLKITGAALNGTVAVVVTDTSGNTNLTVNALGTGTIGVGTVSTGRVTITPVTTITGALTLGGLGTDSGQTATATVCEDTTTHVTYFGSGAAGICKGTSSRRFKHDIEDLTVGLNEIMGLRATSYYLNADMGDATKKIYGFIAEESAASLPELVGYDKNGLISSFDLVGVVPVLVKAVQQLQGEIDALKLTRSASLTPANISK